MRIKKVFTKLISGEGLLHHEVESKVYEPAGVKLNVTSEYYCADCHDYARMKLVPTEVKAAVCNCCGTRITIEEEAE